jgi:hypothetical protein
LVAYRSFLPSTVKRYYIWKEAKVETRQINTPFVQPWSFSLNLTSRPVSFNGNLNEGAFRPNYYFSKLPVALQTFAGLAIQNRTISLTGEFPYIQSNTSTIGRTTGMPAYNVQILYWNYRIEDFALGPTWMRIGSFNISNRPDSCAIYYNNYSLSCIQNVVAPKLIETYSQSVETIPIRMCTVGSCSRSEITHDKSFKSASDYFQCFIFFHNQTRCQTQRIMSNLMILVGLEINLAANFLRLGSNLTSSESYMDFPILERVSRLFAPKVS